MKSFKRSFLMIFSMLLVLCAAMVMNNKKADAAETLVAPSASMATAPEIQVGATYYATMNNEVGYVSFVTPAQGGYVTVYFKNISMDSWSNAYVKTFTDESLHHFDVYKGNESSVEYKSEPGKAHNATLEPGTRYYIQMGDENKAGNVLFSVSFAADINPNGTDQAEPIALNTSYTRTIDADKQDDLDCFKFKTTTGGAARLTFSKTGNGWLKYSVRKCSTLELAKNSKGYDINDDFYGSSTEIDAVFEPNTEYYLQFWKEGKTTYTFSICNQSVTSIAMPNTMNLAAGDSISLGAVANPENAYNRGINYSSSNGDIVSVSSDGTVHASYYKCGVAVITATAADGGGATATCRVVVTPSKASTPWVKSYSANSIKLEWSSTSGATGYEVYTLAGKKWKKIGTTKSTSFTHKKLKPGTKHQYRIRAVVGLIEGKYYSPYSDKCYGATKAAQTKITHVATRKKTRHYYSYNNNYTKYRATIYWKKVKGVSGYKVYYRLPGSTYKYTVGTTKKTSIKVESVIHSTGVKTRYFYVVPYVSTGNKTYDGKISKARKYKFH